MVSGANAHHSHRIPTTHHHVNFPSYRSPSLQGRLTILRTNSPPPVSIQPPKKNTTSRPNASKLCVFRARITYTHSAAHYETHKLRLRARHATPSRFSFVSLRPRRIRCSGASTSWLPLLATFEGRQGQPNVRGSQGMPLPLSRRHPAARFHRSSLHRANKNRSRRKGAASMVTHRKHCYQQQQQEEEEVRGERR